MDEEMLKRRNPNSQVLKSAGDALLRSLREEKTSISKQAMMRSLRSYQPNNINDAASMRALRSYKPNIAEHIARGRRHGHAAPAPRPRTALSAAVS